MTSSLTTPEHLAKLAEGLTAPMRKRLEGLYELQQHGKTWMSAHGSTYISTARISSEKLVELGLVERRNARKAASGKWLDRGYGVLTADGLALHHHLKGTTHAE